MCTSVSCIISAPLGPPQSVSCVPITSRSIFLTWQPPSTPNGIIRNYRINITEQDNSRSWQIISRSPEELITELHPYYIYSVSVAAVTVAEGPYSVHIQIRTYQDGKWHHSSRGVCNRHVHALIFCPPSQCLAVPLAILCQLMSPGRPLH